MRFDRLAANSGIRGIPRLAKLAQVGHVGMPLLRLHSAQQLVSVLARHLHYYENHIRNTLKTQ
jgi:hypothetical protein